MISINLSRFSCRRPNKVMLLSVSEVTIKTHTKLKNCRVAPNDSEEIDLRLQFISTLLLDYKCLGFFKKRAL